MNFMPILLPASFVLDGQVYEFVHPERVGLIGEVKSWVMDHYPKVRALVPLKAGGKVGVYAEATQWNRTQISVRWFDDDKNALTAWLPKLDVRAVTNSEWDIDQYNRCPEWLRFNRWDKRLPGFLPD